MTHAKTFATALLAAERPEDHPFVRAMFDGSLPLEVAQRTALEIAHVVACFPRFLAAVIANIDDHRERMLLVDNLYEEHGRMDPSHVHEVTYRGFLRELGLDDARAAAHRPGLGVIVYNRAMLDLCRTQRVPEALGALGVVEEIVARASVGVRRYAAHRRAASDEAHFSVHETLDLRHADELYDLAEPHWARGDDEAVRLGMRLGHRYHLRLYTDVLAGR